MTKHTKAVALAAVVVVAVLSTAACSDTMTKPTADRQVAVSAGDVLPSVPAARVDLPPTPRAWDNDAEALRSELEKSGGLAIVRIKEPGSSRASEAGGLRASLSSDGFARGIGALTESGATVEHVYPLLGMAVVRIPAEAVSAIHRNPRVDFVEPESETMEPSEAVAATANVSGGTRPAQRSAELAFAQETPWGVSMVSAPQAWLYATGVTEKVMIISRWGLTLGHEDLPAIPPSNCGGYFGPCSSPFGYVANWGAGALFAVNNTLGVVGVAQGVQGTNAFSWRACSEPDAQGLNDSCYTNMVITGIEQAIFLGVRTVLIYDIYFLTFNQALSDALATAWQYGVVTVAGVGTTDPSRQYMYPASYSQTVGVSGVLEDRSFATNTYPQNPCGIGSGYGTYKVDVSAPYFGRSTWVPPNYYYYPTCGTRIAAAHVAGVLALIRARFPTMSAADAYNRLISSASYAGDGEHFGAGIVNAFAAVQNLPGPVTVSIDGPRYVTEYSTCTWIADAIGGQPPYTYQWFLNGSPAGTDGSFTYTASTMSFTLEVWVNDSGGSGGASQLTVDINRHAEPCLQ